MINTNEKVSLAATGGAVAGVILVEGLREVDKKLGQTFLTNKATNSSTVPPLLMKPLGNFGSPSVIVGGAVGAVSLGVGLYAAHTGKVVRQPEAQVGLSTFGGAALSAAVVSGLMPTSQWTSAVAVDPSNAIGFNPRPSLSVPRNGAVSPSVVIPTG